MRPDGIKIISFGKYFTMVSLCTWVLFLIQLLSGVRVRVSSFNLHRRPEGFRLALPTRSAHAKVEVAPTVESYQNLSGRFAALLAKESDLHIVYENLNQHTYIMPRSFANATSEDVWSWWQKKKELEKILKSAIASNEVNI